MNLRPSTALEGRLECRDGAEATRSFKVYPRPEQHIPILDTSINEKAEQSNYLDWSYVSVQNMDLGCSAVSKGAFAGHDARS